MSKADVAYELSKLASRDDIPLDVKSIVSDAAATLRTPLQTDHWIYRIVVIVLGATVIMTVFGGIWIAAFIAKGDVTIGIPDAVVAIGSAAVGALAGLLAPSPVAAQ